MKLLDKEALQFDDVLLEPQYSDIRSRKDVDISSNVGGLQLKVPLISSPMDTVTTPKMATVLHSAGAIGALHRFQTIQDNINEFKATPDAIVSVGLNDWERIEALCDAGADKFLLDVAHGAQESVVSFVNEFRARFKNNWLMIGNFATGNQILDVKLKLNNPHYVDAYRVGVGGGAACSTRLKTGHGLPTLESIISCSRTGEHIVADGGIRNSGDLAKALAAGARAVMIGRILAGTDETPNFFTNENLSEKEFAEKLHNNSMYDVWINNPHKMYRGSASAESYQIQGKDWACAEGEAYEVPHKGPVLKVINELEAGLRSAMTYTGARNLDQFQQKAIFVRVSGNGSNESKVHGRNQL